jgi:hypothetical protein
VATRTVGPMFGKGFGASQARTFMPAGSAATAPVTQLLVGAACGALAVCGVQLVMVLLSEIELNRSVDAISE